MFIKDTSGTEFIDIDIIGRIKKIATPIENRYTVQVFTKCNPKEPIQILSVVPESEADDIIHRIGECKDRKNL
ncbi:hypothetical protein F4X33_13740 [Candidatus Poribacteria bacterium]|nr:hypothetical protein [Candidatus Poribacteria bacterium]